jgi:long-chain acyl-CoA synthetase
MAGGGVQASPHHRPWHAVWPPHVPTSMAYPACPAWWILWRNLPRYAARPAIRVLDPESAEERQAVTYGALARCCDALAAGLRRRGVRAGERVAFYLPNVPALVVSYFGTWRAGAVGVPCNPLHRAGELEYQLRDSGARLVITCRTLAATAEDAAGRIGIPVVLAPEGAPDDGTGPGGAAWLDVLREPDGSPPPAIDPHRDLALLLYTGGTTGLPKAAMLTHGNIMANTAQFAAWYAFEDGREICISALPLSHSGGMAGAMNVPLYSGATMLLVRRFRPAGVLAAIPRYRATRFFGVPTMYMAVLNLPDRAGYDLSSLRACRTSAAPLPAAVKREFDGLAGREVLVEGYGLSETSPLAIANPIGRAKAGSVGIPLPDTDAAVMRPGTHEPLPPGEEGEIVLRGPQVMRGYWNRPEETALAFAGGWFHTGDFGRMDGEGYFWIVDRLKDMINTAGYKVWPREVEEVLYAHPAVQMAAVVGVPDGYRGEVVKAFLVLKDAAAGAVTPDDMIAHCRERLAAYKVPRLVEFCRELPASGAGKLLKRLLRESPGR